MKSYEVIFEIFNECERNRMRDVEISEITTDDVEGTFRSMLKGGCVTYEKQVLPDGSIVFDINEAGMLQRCTFTEII